jgi:chromosomal replication initiation ATPase DnaA
MNPAEVVRVVMAVSGFSAEMIMGPRRTGELVRARQIVCLLMHENCPCTVTYLAAFMYRDRATFSHSWQTARKRLNTREDYALMYRCVRARLFVERILEAAA